MSRSVCGTRRDLSQNKLSGEIPSAFSAMTALVALCARSQPLLWTARTIRVVRHRELSENALGGELPEGFSALKDLEFLCAGRTLPRALPDRRAAHAWIDGDAGPSTTIISAAPCRRRSAHARSCGLCKSALTLHILGSGSRRDAVQKLR